MDININIDFSKDEELNKYKGTYTKCAIYIDKHIPDIAEPYKNPGIETKVFECIYAICYVLSCKKKWFETINAYREFSLYAAGEFYIMFRNRYNNQGQIRMGKVVKPIKSSLNIIRRVLYAFKIEYAKKFFHQIYRDDWGEEEEDQNRKKLERKKKEAVAHYIREDVENSNNYIITKVVVETCNRLPFIIKDIIKDTPYKNDDLMQSRLYKTCLLSLINNITFPNTIKEKIENMNNFEQLAKKYQKEESNCIILWHLDENISEYVELILSRIKEKFASEIGEDIRDYSLDEITINDIINTAYNTYDTDQSGENF